MLTLEIIVICILSPFGVSLTTFFEISEIFFPFLDVFLKGSDFEFFKSNLANFVNFTF